MPYLYLAFDSDKFKFEWMLSLLKSNAISTQRNNNHHNILLFLLALRGNNRNNNNEEIQFFFNQLGALRNDEMR